jgi:hypothetical protein
MIKENLVKIKVIKILNKNYDILCQIVRQMYNRPIIRSY